MEFISGFLKRVDPVVLMEIGLQRYQTEILGKNLLNCGDVVSICESLKKHQDVLVKNKGQYIEIVEIRRRLKEKESLPFQEESIEYLHEACQLKDWQKEIMEQDQARVGLLFGDVI